MLCGNAVCSDWEGAYPVARSYDPIDAYWIGSHVPACVSWIGSHVPACVYLDRRGTFRPIGCLLCDDYV